MNARHKDPRLSALLSEAYSQSSGPRRMFLLEQAINVADALGDVKSGWDLRLRMINDAEMSGFGDRTIVAVAWCLGVSDRDPQTFPIERVLWQLKWVVLNAVDYATVPRRAIMGVLDELESRYRAAGWGMRAVYHKRMSAHWALGDLDQVRHFERLWQAAPRDTGSDCLACERDQLIELRLQFGEAERAVRDARPLIEERQSCSHVPQRTYCRLTFSNWALGRHVQAMEMQRRGVKATREGLEYLVQSVQHALFAACTGAHQTALTLLERRLRDIERATAETSRLIGYQCAASTIRALRLLGHDSAETLQPVKLAWMESQTADLATWEAALLERARSLGERFDARAGNTYRADELRAFLALAERAPEMAKVAAGLETS